MKETLRGRKLPTSDDLDRRARDCAQYPQTLVPCHYPKVAREMATVHRPPLLDDMWHRPLWEQGGLNWDRCR
jgi:hypothetical protein